LGERSFGDDSAPAATIFGAMASGFKELKLWQEAVILGGEVIRAIRQENRREHKAFADVVMLESASVATLIADGQGRYESAEQQRCYRAARSALAALETRLAIARHGGIISATVLARLNGQAAIVGRLLAGYLTYIERQIAAEEQHAGRGRVLDDRPVRLSGPAPPASANEPIEQVDGPES
jgi:four helix bundle protein